ncbi:MAG: cyclic pyranopterin monophosphate synthase MoaC [Bdellovibrionota bacterium]
MVEMFTHVDKNNRPSMVDVSDKAVTIRVAWARTKMKLPQSVISAFNGIDITTKKGPVFNTAIVAGTLAAKKTSDLIPFCHPLFLEDVKLEIKVLDCDFIQIDAKVKTTGKTGVEMEALTAVQVAALTVYDMCKSAGHGMEILECYLVEKSGGKQNYHREGVV